MSVQVLQMYLPFCGIAISNAQLFAASRKEYDRSRVRTHLLQHFIKTLLYFCTPPTVTRLRCACVRYDCHVGVYYVVRVYLSIDLLLPTHSVPASRGFESRRDVFVAGEA